MSPYPPNDDGAEKSEKDYKLKKDGKEINTGVKEIIREKGIKVQVDESLMSKKR